MWLRQHFGIDVGSGQYVFRLTSVELDQTVPVCNKTLEQKPAYLFGDYSSSSQFFVFVGVMAFLFSLASIIVYAFYDEMYMTTDLWPKVVCLCMNLKQVYCKPYNSGTHLLCYLALLNVNYCLCMLGCGTTGCVDTSVAHSFISMGRWSG